MADGLYAHVTTGVQYGDVDVTCHLHTNEPALDIAAWNDVVEFSMLFDEGGLLLTSPDDNEDTVDLPGNEDGARWWRLRLHVRGRDETPTQVYANDGDDVIEGHLIQLWPAPRDVEVRHTLTDQLGLSARTPYQPDPELVGSWPMLLNNQCHSLSLRIGVDTPVPEAGEGVLTVSADRSAARIANRGQGDRKVYGNVTSYRQRPPSSPGDWEQIIEFSMEGDTDQLFFEPDNDPNSGNWAVLPPPTGEERWRLAVHIRGRDSASREEEYEVLAWPAPYAETVVHHGGQ
ncbi:hypothetical protein ABZ746_36270 [Streptomyces sp. NPDC020096]